MDVFQLHMLKQIILALVPALAPGAVVGFYGGMRQQMALQPRLPFERFLAQMALVDVVRVAAVAVVNEMRQLGASGLVR